MNCISANSSQNLAFNFGATPRKPRKRATKSTTSVALPTVPKTPTARQRTAYLRFYQVMKPLAAREQRRLQKSEPLPPALIPRDTYENAMKPGKEVSTGTKAKKKSEYFPHNEVDSQGKTFLDIKQLELQEAKRAHNVKWQQEIKAEIRHAEQDCAAYNTRLYRAHSIEMLRLGDQAGPPAYNR
jgi:hypothetical protein